MKLFSRKAWPVILMLGLSLTGCGTQGGGSAGTPQQATTRAEERARAHTELAAQYYDRAQLGVALEELDKALHAQSNYAPAYNVRGLVRMALREYTQAEQDFRRSLQLDSNDSNTHNNYGWFLCQRGRERESIEHFLAALKNPLYATPAKAYLNAGMCSRKGGNMKDAEEFLQKALVVQPNMPEALFALSDVAFAREDYAGAKSWFLRFAKYAENLSAENLWLAVRIERKLGDKNAEGNYAIQLRKRFPDARETQLMLQRP
ncbi:MAG: type IV pilus biogenesis/stability protein PilW [Gallionellaceae bacterium]|nr:type IV pilus biogenesis/stability protein PilW [Gallionellaceae bacterium]